jgi:hypothetical protein
VIEGDRMIDVAFSSFTTKSNNGDKHEPMTRRGGSAGIPAEEAKVKSN